MMKCNPTVYANCPDRKHCGHWNDAVFAEGSECDKFNQKAINGCIVHLPCKIGDKLWGFRKVGRHDKTSVLRLQECEVTQMLFSPEMELILVLGNIGHRQFGVDAFYTREEAERALKEVNRGD